MNNKYNNINIYIVQSILKDKEEIKLLKKIAKEKLEEFANENRIGSYNKLVGNLTATILRKQISNILNYHNTGLKVSAINSFVKGYPTEYDLIIVRDTANDYNGSNVYDPKDVVALLEFKTSGLIMGKNKSVGDFFDKVFNEVNTINNNLGANYNIPFAYITFSESPEYLNDTATYFNSKNNRINTAFGFIDYDKLEGHDILKLHTSNENYNCYDFEEFILDLIKQN